MSVALAPTPQRSGAMRVLFNAMSGAGNRIATTAIGFLLTPFIIHTLGIGRYGLWAIVGSLAGYLGLLDFGLGGAFVKFITEYVQRDDRASARQVVSFGIVFYALFGLVFAAPVMLLAPYIVHAFKMQPDQYGTAATFLRVMFGILVATMIFNVPGMVVVSMQRMDLASRNNFSGYLVYAGSTTLFLKLGWSLNGVVAGQACGALATAGLQYWTARRHFGSIWHNPLRFDRAIVKRLFGFGGWVQLTSLLGIVNLDVGRFIAAGLVSVASVGYYEIASKLAFFAKLFPNYMLDALMPAASAADARSDEQLLQRIYAAGTRYQVFFTLACAGFVIGGADPMVRVWLGQRYPYVSTIVFWLALGFAASSLTGVSTTLLRAAGRPKYETAFTAVVTVGNLLSTIFLVRSYGIVGVAMGTSIGWMLGTLYFTSVFHRIRRSPFWGTIGRPSLSLAAAAALATAAYYEVVHVPAIARCFENRVLGLVVLGIVVAGYFALFTALTWILGAWRDDRAELVSRCRQVRATLSRRLSTNLSRRGA